MVARSRARLRPRGRAHDRNGHRWRYRARGTDLSRGLGRRGRDRPHVDRFQRPALQVRQRRLPRGLRVGPRDRGARGRGNRNRRRQYRQYLQPRGGGDLRRRNPGRGEAVRAAPRRSEAPGLQARCRCLPHRPRGAHRNGGRVWRRGRVRSAHLGNGVKRLGVIGSMVWDTIYGRDAAQPAVQEWGGIGYSLAALDATLADAWQIVPLIKVGRDLAPRAAEFLGTLHHVAPGARFFEVPAANNRVTLRYQQRERRCEQMSGGVPPWTWPELGAQVTDLDALYVNFISGYEMSLEAAQLLRRGFPHFLYADLHSLFLGK